jgi:2-hydroxychromene-2-carboxylate isomerase
MKYLKNIRPVVPHIPVTGAAQRAVAAANAAALEVYDHLEAVQESMIAHDATPEANRDAVWCVEALRLADREAQAADATAGIVKRWQSSAQQLSVRGRPYVSYEWATYIESLSDRLRNAGVPMPMPLAGVLTVQYWQDAAALGC